MKKLYSIFFVLILFNCAEAPHVDKGEEMVVEKEIRKRMDTLAHYDDLTKKLDFDPVKIHKRVQDFILMSKDKENIKASINLSNLFFSDLIQKHQLNPTMLQTLDPAMNPYEISFCIKQNELYLLNQFMLQNLKQTITLTPVY